MEINKRLSEIRAIYAEHEHRATYSQEKIGEKCGTTYIVWGRMERGQTPVSADLVKNIQLSTGWSYDFIIDGKQRSPVDGMIIDESQGRSGDNKTDQSKGKSKVSVTGDHAKVVGNNDGIVGFGDMKDVTLVQSVPPEHQERIMELLYSNRRQESEIAHLKEQLAETKKINKKLEEQNVAFQSNMEKLIDAVSSSQKKR